MTKPPLLILGAPPRGGNHLLRGLLDHHPQLLLPPDEDYFVRHLSRHPLLRWRGMLASSAQAPGFFRQLQKDGHLERINAGHGTEVFDTEDSLDLEAYYGYISEHHQRGSVDSLVRNHVEALAVALGHTEADGRLRVIFCALQPSNSDLSRVSTMLVRSYDVRGIFLVRDPRAHLSSKLVRNPTLNLSRFCQRQNRYWKEIEWFSENCGPALRLRFEDLVTDTENCMREVCKFARIEFSPGVLEYTQGGVVSRSNSSFSVAPTGGGPTDRGPTGGGPTDHGPTGGGPTIGIDYSVLTRYRETLPAETIAYLEAHCLPELFWNSPSDTAQPFQPAGAT